MIDIKNIGGSILFSVLPDESAVFHEELMTSDYVQLSWDSDVYKVIPAGTYIEYDGEKYKLLDNYTPSQQDECTYQYTPQFQSRIMNWGKQITPIYTYAEDGATVKGREMDWEFTGSPADAMYIVKQAIKNETGEDWTIQLADALPATITISSQSSSIFAMLNTISGECGTEWWADKKTNTLYLSKCIFGDAVTLEVGDNVQVPTVTNDSEGYFTRFYAFGSTRNITQDYEGGGATNHIVNKRLTLNPTKYPNGYKDIKEGLKREEVFVKALFFDDIYPSSKLKISDVRARLKYRLDNNGNKIKIGGTDEEPIYEQYAIWYFQIEGFDFNPSTDVIEGLNLSVSFQSGQLAQREFELTYHEKATTVNDAADVTAFNIKQGDYEINIDESTGVIIPGTSYIIPQEGDSIILFNIVMPEEYVASAQDELEKELDKAMLSYIEDNNTYQMSSDPTRFYENETDIQMGQAVTFVNGSKSLSTRVQMVEKRLDLNCYQTIKVGNKIIKGNTQQLKDEVANVNQNLDVIKAFNELSSSLSQAYANAQREMIEGFAAIKELWKLETDEYGNKYAYTKYDIFGKGGITAYTAGKAQVPSIYEGIPFDNKTIWLNPETRLVEVIGGIGEEFDSSKMWSLLGASTNEQINKSHLTTALSSYATTSQLNTKWTQDNTKISHWDEAYNLRHSHSNKSVIDSITSGKVSNWDKAYSWGNHANAGYAKQTSLDAVSSKLNDFLEGSDTDTIINKWKELESFLSGMTESDNLADILSTKADKSFVTSELTKYVTLTTSQTISGAKTFTSLLTTAAIKAKGDINTPNVRTSDSVYINGIRLYKSPEGNLILDGNLLVTGGVTAYSTGEEGGGSSGGLDVDLMWEILGGTGTQQINKTHLTDALNGYATQSWVTSQNYLKSVSIATISDLNSSWDALLKAAPSVYVTRHPTISEVTNKQSLVVKLNSGTTEGTNQFTYNATAAKTINITPSGIGAAASSHSHNTLDCIELSGTVNLNTLNLSSGSPEKAMYICKTDGGGANITGRPNDSTKSAFMLTVELIRYAGNTDYISKQTYVRGQEKIIWVRYCTSGTWTSWERVYTTAHKPTLSELGAAASSHNHSWSNITSGKPTTLSGYGITDAYTKTEADNKYLLKTSYTAADVLSKLKTVDGSGSGLDADLLDGKHLSDLVPLKSQYGLHSFDTRPYNYMYLCRIANTKGYSTLRLNLSLKARYSQSDLYIAIECGKATTSTTVHIRKCNTNISPANLYYKTITEGSYVYVDLYMDWGAWNAGGYVLTNVGVDGILSHTPKGTLIDSLPSGYVTIRDIEYKVNVNSATKLQTARQINGTNFDGTANITTAKWGTARTITLGSYLSGSVSLDGSANVTLNANVIGLTSQGRKTAISGTTIPSSGVRLYEVYNNGYPTTYGNLLSIKGGGSGELLLAWKNTNRIYYRSKSDVQAEKWMDWSTVAFLTDNVASATKLQTSRTLWGQNFDGTANVSGNMTGVGSISASGDIITSKSMRATDMYINGVRVYKPQDKVLKIEGNLLVTGGITQYSIDSGDYPDIKDIVNNYVTNAVNNKYEIWKMLNESYTDGTLPANMNGSAIDKYDSSWTGSFFGFQAKSSNSGLFFHISHGGSPFLAFRIAVDGSRWLTEWRRFSYTDSYNNLSEVNNVYSTGEFFNGSDARNKNILDTINCISLDNIVSLPIIKFRWNNRVFKDDGRTRYGTIAQEVQKILPELVYDRDNSLYMDYAVAGAIFSISIAKSLKGTKSEVERLKERVRILEEMLNIKQNGYEEVNTLAN